MGRSADGKEGKGVVAAPAAAEPAAPAEPPAPARRSQGDALKHKPLTESEFQTRFTPGAVPGTPVKLGAKEYDEDLWDSPALRGIKRALVSWEIPPAGSGRTLGRVLKDDDPRLVPTFQRPGREGFRAALTRLLVSAGQVQPKPTAFFLAGPLGVGKLAIAQRLYEVGGVPEAVVKADADYLHALVPEQSELLALGEGRASDVVHEEASGIGHAAFAQALADKRDVLHNTMLGSSTQLQRLAAAKAAGFKRVVIAVVSSVEVATERAGADGAVFPEAVLLGSHRDFARGFDEVVKVADELVLLANTGPTLELVAVGRNGQLQVKNEKAYAAFRAQKGA
ncbi:MAG: zeta toxin family protein [Archangiaceae bacterium]|nr:zeta toxin family protein [Archangiaceae bacterium]